MGRLTLKRCSLHWQHVVQSWLDEACAHGEEASEPILMRPEPARVKPTGRTLFTHMYVALSCRKVRGYPDEASEPICLRLVATVLCGMGVCVGAQGK